MAELVPPTHPVMQRPFPWEKSYPPGVSWDAPIADGTLVGLLARSVEQFGALPALSYFGWRVTYREFGNLVDRAAVGLAKLGVGREKPLALFLPNTPWHPILFFGALKLGARLVHISPLDAERDIVHKLKDTGARIIATTDAGAMRGAGQKLAAGLGAAGLVDHIIVGEDEFWHAGPRAARVFELARLISGVGLLDAEPLQRHEFPVVVPEDVALMQFTGGTTGLPKAALLTHRNLHSAVEIYHAWAEPQGMAKQGEGRVLLVLPLFHIFALSAIMLTTIQNGAELVLHPRFDAAAVVDDIEKRKITFFPGVPTMWIAIRAFPRNREARSLLPRPSGVRRRTLPGRSGAEDQRVDQVAARRRLGND